MEVFGSLRNIFGSLRTSSDIIGALRKILALSGEKCHAYKLKKGWQVYTSQLKYISRLEGNVSHVMGQNSLTTEGKQNSL